MARWGFPLSKEEVKDVVHEFVEQNNLNQNFAQNGPGDDWFTAFIKRHRLSLKTPEPLEAVKRTATADPFVIFNFYDLLEEQIKALNLDGKPECIYNLGETVFNLDPLQGKAVGEKGQQLHRNIQGSGRENTTVLACVSAAGDLLPPLIVFKAARLWTTWKGENDLENTFYSCSEKGWMTIQVFQEWFCKFCKYVKERPLLLIFDGHFSHLDAGTVTKAKEENITILKLPPHTIDLLQPLDKTCFRPLKLLWDRELSAWQKEHQRKLNKSEFADLLCKVCHDGIKPENIVKGFATAEIYPVNRDRYPKQRLNCEKLKRYNEYIQKKETVVTEDVTAGGIAMELDESQPCCSNSDSFEYILLKKIAKPEAPPMRKRRKIDSCAKVITTEEFADLITKKQDKSEKTTLSPRVKLKSQKHPPVL